MKNGIQNGDVLDLVAPSGGVVAGRGYVIGAFFAIAATTVAQGALFAGETRGVFELPAETHASTQALTAGDPVYWDAANARCTKTSTGNRLIGAAIEDKASTAALVRVKLWPRAFAPAAAITDPTGGATVDSQARTAINTIIDALWAAGIVVPN